MLSYQDNNNGFFICIIEPDLSLNYAFLNGFEDAEEIKIRTPKEYLNLFYSKEDLGKEIFNFMQKQFKKFEKFKTIPENSLNDVVEYLNENKPNWATQ